MTPAESAAAAELERRLPGHAVRDFSTRPLSPTARMLVMNPANDIPVSPAGYWEIASVSGAPAFDAYPITRLWQPLVRERWLQVRSPDQ